MGQTTGQFMLVNQPFTCPIVLFTTRQMCKEKIDIIGPIIYNYLLSNYYIHILYVVMCTSCTGVKSHVNR